MISWVHMRFRQWGEWMQKGQRDSSAGLVANWEPVGSSNFRQAVVPIKSLDCRRVNDWVAGQDKDAQLLMYRVYCTAKTARQNAVLLDMSVRTLYARLHALQSAFAQLDDGGGTAVVEPVSHSAE